MALMIFLVCFAGDGGGASSGPAPVRPQTAPTDSAVMHQVETGMEIFGEGFEDFMAATQG